MSGVLAILAMAGAGCGDGASGTGDEPAEAGEEAAPAAPPPAKVGGLQHTALVDARVELGGGAGQLAVEVELTLVTDGQRHLVFDFLPADAVPGGVEVRDLARPERPLIVHHEQERLIVEVGRRARGLTLSVRYRAALDHGGVDRITGREVLLYHAWIPHGGGAATWRVQVTHPRALTLHGPVDATFAVDAGERRRTRWEVRQLERFALLGAPAYQESSFEHRGVRVEVALWPEHADRAPAVADAVRASLDAFAPLGAFPRDHLRVVEGGAGEGRVGLAFRAVISLGHEIIAGEHLLPRTTDLSAPPEWALPLH